MDNQFDERNPLYHFRTLSDPRVERTRLHPLTDIVFLTIMAVLSGADGWVGVEEFGKEREGWLRKYLELPAGIPSHDTIGNVMGRICPEAFESCFLSWINAIADLGEQEIVAIDGKTLRKSYDKGSSKAAIHMVSAWANTNELILGQVKVDDKSNEITAIPRLIEALFLEGALVTIDAMGCQKAIVANIIDKKADYLISLKGNQSTLHQQVIYSFESQPCKHTDEQIDYGHGRIEERRCSVITELKWIEEPEVWKGLKSIVKLDSQRHDLNKGETQRETRYYISSLQQDPALINKAIRSHWAIENKVHWILDVAFREDDSRIRQGNAAQNFSVIRRIALNLLKNYGSPKIGIQNKRLKLAWNPDKLLDVLKN